MQQVSVVIASPNDVKDERDRCERTIKELNDCVAEDRSIHLVPLRYEKDVIAGLDENGPQGVIDRDLRIAERDIVVGIFWKRFGTPTSDGRTGTEHEIEIAERSLREKGRPRIMLWFRDADTGDPEISGEQYT